MTFDRRGFLAACSRAGVVSALLPGVLFTLATQAQDAAPKSEPPKITPELLDQAAVLAGISLTADQKKMMLDGLNDQRGSYTATTCSNAASSICLISGFISISYDCRNYFTEILSTYAYLQVADAGSCTFKPSGSCFQLSLSLEPTNSTELKVRPLASLSEPNA